MTPFMPGEVNNFQQTIRREREFVGIGLHNGRVAKVTCVPWMKTAAYCSVAWI